MALLAHIELKLIFVCALYCYANDYNQNPSSQFAEALLYHQFHLKPSQADQAQTPRPSRYTQYNQTESYTSSGSNPAHLRAQPSNRQQHASSQQHISYLTARDSPEDFYEDNYGCPYECHCNRLAQIADCSSRNLTKVPKTFPQDIKRIRLERNNITEIGAFAFQGLKRLQRIDLSNNNLQRIDSQAFSGGLQSLNSLILYSNKLEFLSDSVFNDLNQLQLLLLNANSLQSVSKELFGSLANLNLLSLYDNTITTLANGTFDGLKSIKTIHLGKNPLVCDCQLRWLADYLETNPVETSEAKCEAPTRAQGRKLSQLNKNEFKCQEQQPTKGPTQSQTQNPIDQSGCPAGCVCNGVTVDCSRASQSESRTGQGTYELPDVPDDVPVYVARVHINDNRIKRIRQTGLFRRLANSQKLDLGNNKIIDIEDNAINGQFSGSNKPERVVFVLLENQSCDASRQQSTSGGGGGSESSQMPQANGGPSNRLQTNIDQQPDEDPCKSAPKVNEPQFDSPCYNGGSCKAATEQEQSSHLVSLYSNYTCMCPPGFAGPLCEINIDDCVDHQCQNGAACIDGVNSYRCACRDPTTTGEFCEQLSPSTSNSFSYATSSANSIAPIALPIIASSAVAAQSNSISGNIQNNESASGYNVATSIGHTVPVQPRSQQMLARSADFLRPSATMDDSNQVQTSGSSGNCRRITKRQYYDDGKGCQSVRLLKLSECVGSCVSEQQTNGANGCCTPTRVKRRRIRMQCNDGASYVKTIDLVKKCSCSQGECSPLDIFSGTNLVYPVASSSSHNDASRKQQQQQQTFNSNRTFGIGDGSETGSNTQDDQLMQITRLDAVE